MRTGEEVAYDEIGELDYEKDVSKSLIPRLRIQLKYYNM